MAARAMKALPFVAPAVWMAYVWQTRAQPPKLAAFIPGSADFVYANELETGDVLLFSRNCGLMWPVGAALCRETKRVSNHHIDHCGVVVLDPMGVPYVLEATLSGTKLRPYEQRVLRSRSHEIVLRPLKAARSEESREAVRRFARAQAARPEERRLSARQVQGLYADGEGEEAPVSQAAALVAETLRAMGVSVTGAADAHVLPRDWAEGGAQQVEGGFAVQHYIRVR